MCNKCEEKITTEKVKVNKPSRPICLEMRDAKTELFKTVTLIADKYHLPFFLMESMVNDLAQRVTQLAETERKTALENYNKQLEESGWE